MTGRQGALANGPEWAAPIYTGRSYTPILTVQPVSEGLEDFEGTWVGQALERMNRCVKRTLGN